MHGPVAASGLDANQEQYKLTVTLFGAGYWAIHVSDVAAE